MHCLIFLSNCLISCLNSAKEPFINILQQLTIFSHSDSVSLKPEEGEYVFTVRPVAADLDNSKGRFSLTNILTKVSNMPWELWLWNFLFVSA